MEEEEFVDASGLSSRDSFVIEPSPTAHEVQSAPSVPASATLTQVANKLSATTPTEDSEDDTSAMVANKLWSWGGALLSAASSSVHVLEQGMSKVLDVIDEDGPSNKASKSKPSGEKQLDDDEPITPIVRDQPGFSSVDSSLGKEESAVNRPPGGATTVLPLSVIGIPEGVRDDLKVFSSAFQRTSGRLLGSGLGVLRKTFELLAVEDEQAGTSEFSRTLREARDKTEAAEKEQRRHVAYWLDMEGISASIEALRCLAETYSSGNPSDSDISEAAKLLDACTEDIVRKWDSKISAPASASSIDEAAIFSIDRLTPFLGASTSMTRLSELLEHIRRDFVDQKAESLDKAIETSLKNLAAFTAICVDLVHKQAQVRIVENIGENKESPEQFARRIAGAIGVFADQLSGLALLARRFVARVSSGDNEARIEAAEAVLLESTDCADFLARLPVLIRPFVVATRK